MYLSNILNIAYAYLQADSSVILFLFSNFYNYLGLIEWEAKEQNLNTFHSVLLFYVCHFNNGKYILISYYLYVQMQFV